MNTQKAFEKLTQYHNPEVVDKTKLPYQTWATQKRRFLRGELSEDTMEDTLLAFGFKPLNFQPEKIKQWEAPK